MALKLIQLVGQILARCPEAFSRALSLGIGDLIYFLPTKRRRTVLSNLRHAFPEMTERERRRVARISCRRTVELALLLLVSPHFSREQLTQRFKIDPQFERELNQNATSPEPAVAVVPHLCLMESLTLLPALTTGPCPEIATIYRPLKQSAIEAWVLRTRQRFGMRLLSRRDGFAEAMKMLRDRHVVAILFDQNAGHTGVLSTFLGRVCSSTELPGMLAHKFEARFVAVWTERSGFWRGMLKMEDLPRPKSAYEGIFIANRWFEQKLKDDKGFRHDWLWLHDRWRTQDQPERRLRLEQRRDALAEEVAWRGWSDLPKHTQIWIRVPNWLGDVVMAAPLIRAIMPSRPDARLTLICRQQFQPLLEKLFPECCVRAFSPRKNLLLDFQKTKAWSRDRPGAYILFTNSEREDLLAKRIGAPQRFGIVRPGKPRPMITHHWPLPADLDEASLHQTELWRRFLDHFGLNQAPDFSPIPFAEWGVRDPYTLRGQGRIGLICGTENEPAKRWPVERWRALIDLLPAERFVLFGTKNDRDITNQVAGGYDESRVLNLAGETDLISFAAELDGCRALVTNDTGGMHLANLLGVPVVIVFGPTNPIRTGPCFDAPKALLQPPGCAPTGGGDISAVEAARVAEALGLLLKQRKHA